jgi:adenylate kinase
VERCVVVISGTPGVGKTVVALRITKLLEGIYLNLSEFVINNKLYLYYDEETSSYVIDEVKLKNALDEFIISNCSRIIVIDSHYGEVVDDRFINKIIVLRLNPKELYNRLVSRGWTGRKLRDNVEAELLGVSTMNALEEHGVGRVCEVDTTGRDVDDVVDEIIKIINGVRECEVRINWLEKEDLINELLPLITQT